MKDQSTGTLSGIASALITALAGRHAWVLLAALGMSLAATCWLSTRPNSGLVKILFIEWRAGSEPQAKPEAEAPRSSQTEAIAASQASSGFPAMSRRC